MKSCFGDAGIFYTEHSMEFLLLATVIIYEIRCMDLVFCALEVVLVICSLTKGTEYGSQKRTVFQGTEKVSQ